MAIQPKELYSAAQTTSFSLRMHPHPDGTKPALFFAGTALLPVGTPLVKDSSASQLRAWADADTTTNAIVAFVYPLAVQLVAGAEVIHTVMLKGTLHVDDIPTPAAQTRATLLTALATQTVLNSFLIEGVQQAGV